MIELITTTKQKSPPKQTHNNNNHLSFDMTLQIRKTYSKTKHNEEPLVRMIVDITILEGFEWWWTNTGIQPRKTC